MSRGAVLAVTFAVLSVPVADAAWHAGQACWLLVWVLA